MPGLVEAHSIFRSPTSPSLSNSAFIPPEEHMLRTAQNARRMLDAGFTSCFSAAAAKPQAGHRVAQRHPTTVISRARERWRQSGNDGFRRTRRCAPVSHVRGENHRCPMALRNTMSSLGFGSRGAETTGKTGVEHAARILRGPQHVLFWRNEAEFDQTGRRR